MRGLGFAQVYQKVLPGLLFSAYFLFKTIISAFVPGRQLCSALSMIPVLPSGHCTLGPGDVCFLHAALLEFPASSSLGSECPWINTSLL